MMKQHGFLRLLVLCLPLLLVFLAACGRATSGTSSSNSPGPQTIKITIGDFFVHSPQTTFVTGVPYHFVVTNQGQHHHDFLIMHPMNTETMVMDEVYQRALVYIYNIAPGESKTLDFTFDHTAPAGMLEFSCHYGGHYEAGMHQAIVVNAAPGSRVTPYPNDGIPVQAASTANVSRTCDQPVSVMIQGNGTFDQRSVSLKMGDTLTIVNKTQETFTLTSKPDAGIRFTVVDPRETEYVPFPKAGTFTLSSQEHPSAQLTVQVSMTPGVTCGFEPVATVSFDADYTRASDTYFFVPTAVTLKEGQSIILSNLSDYDLTFFAQPDPGMGNVELRRNEHQLIFFKEAGTYTIACKQFPSQHFTVTVQENGGDND
ncbi:MAG: hypothetical protein IRZ31_01280 [Thermogemmatispora sp.]|uniref:hypothetical protein n=1 Tax=Thermogemmatispora sp. TaxID=1968838 RepID=UPI0026360AA0|nr:hypothetical protein [Thermogemmatispora sp.]MBX5455504.1 hypothetical protein [Thermogemmatispora sp.]